MVKENKSVPLSKEEIESGMRVLNQLDRDLQNFEYRDRHKSENSHVLMDILAISALVGGFGITVFLVFLVANFVADFLIRLFGFMMEVF